MEFLKIQNDESLIKIVNKLPENEEIAKSILKDLNNENVKIIKEKDLHDSYYVFLKDTIYLADNEKNNKGVSRICLIAHECKHSIQSKLMQWINFLLSNIEMIYFLVSFILNLFIKNNIVAYTYVGISTFSIIIRLILEINAVFSSVKISKKYLEKNLENSDEAKKLSDAYKKSTSSLLPLFILSLTGTKIIKIILSILIVKI